MSVEMLPGTALFIILLTFELVKSGQVKSSQVKFIVYTYTLSFCENNLTS